MSALPLAEIRTSKDGDPHAYYPFLRRSLVATEGREERVRVATYNALLTKYGYPAQRIDVQTPVRIRDDEQPRFADIVVYDDDDHKRPLIVAEVKRPKRQDGERQAQRYATILRAVYTLWNNGTDPISASVLVNRYPEEAVAINDIPSFGGEPQYQIQTLNSFPDDRATTQVIRRCHDLIRSLENKKPDKAFDEFLKILFVKFNDELKGSDYDFQVLLRGTPPEPEDPNATAQRIRALFHHAVVSSNDMGTVFSAFDDIALKNETIVQIVRLLQPYSFSSTEVDAKARAFETFLSGDLRQEFKEFMTPRPVVEAIVAMADIKPADYVLDPCCGSAAFLIFALRAVRESIGRRKLSAQQLARQVFDFAHDRLWGMDSSQQMANVGRLNMLVNEDGRTHIFHVQDSLAPLADAPAAVENRRFELVMTNPPFGQRVTGPASLLKTFEVVKKYPKRESGFLSEILFLERNLDWLKSNGRMFIVLPDSVLGNVTLAAVREFLETRARLVAVLSLPPDTFGPSGAKSKTSVVLLQKYPEPTERIRLDEDVFLADVRQIGYDFTGRATAEANQLPEVVTAFQAWRVGEPISTPLVRVVQRSALGSVWLAQPHFTKQESVQSGTSRSKSKHWVLGDICERIGAGKTPARSQFTTSGVHLVKVGNLTGRGIQWSCVERQYVSAGWLTKHPAAALQRNDILFTSAAHGPKWIGLKVDLFTDIPPLVGTAAAFCGELMLVRLKADADVNPLLVFLFLRSPAGYAAIQRCIRGQSGHVYREQVETIRIPKPSAAQLRAVQDAMRVFTTAMDLQAQAQVKMDDADRLSAAAFPTTAKKPIIAR